MSEPDASRPSRQPASDTPHPVWRERWFQWALGLLVAVAALSLVVPLIFNALYATRSVLVPLLIGLMLAYIVNPLVSFLQHRLRLSRLIATGAIIGLFLAVILAGLLLLVPPVVRQGASLIENLKEVYPKVMVHVANALEERGQDDDAQDAGDQPSADTGASGQKQDDTLAGLEPSEDASPVEAGPVRLITDEQLSDWFNKGAHWLNSLDWAQIQAFLIQSLDIGVGVIGSAITFTTYLVVAGMVVFFCFFFFTWHFEAICRWFVPFIPASQRAATLDVITQMDACVSAFVRGRLIQVAFVATILTTGWWICGVPYFLLLGLLGGLLNLIPYAAVFILPVALGVTSLDQLAAGGGYDWFWALLMPSVVYLIAQTLDSYGIEPIVQGKATDLDPLTVLIVVLLGGSIAGLLGMLLAIPVAACVKIFSKVVLLPRLRALAARG